MIDTVDRPGGLSPDAALAKRIIDALAGRRIAVA